FQKLQLVQNGQVIATEPAEIKERTCSARLSRTVKLDGPSWFAVRIDSTTKNEFERVLFAHTSPVYVDVAGQRVFDVEAARDLLRQLEEAQADIRARGQFSNAQASERVLAVYQQAARDLTDRLKQRGN